MIVTGCPLLLQRRHHLFGQLSLPALSKRTRTPPPGAAPIHRRPECHIVLSIVIPAGAAAWGAPPGRGEDAVDALELREVVVQGSIHRLVAVARASVDEALDLFVEVVGLAVHELRRVGYQFGALLAVLVLDLVHEAVLLGDLMRYISIVVMTIGQRSLIFSLIVSSGFDQRSSSTPVGLPDVAMLL